MGLFPQYYILVGRLPVAVDFMTWAKWTESMDARRVARTEINERCHISTVFLGLDHNFRGRGDPVLFETMIFGGPLDGQQWRCCTYNEAEHLHAEIVTQARIACAQIDAIAAATGAKE
jgi:hypothetical protein